MRGYVSLSSRAGAEISRLGPVCCFCCCCCCFSSPLLGSLINTIRAPTHAAWQSFPRTRPFLHARQGMPVSSDCTVRGHWCSSDDHADVAASFSISRLASGVLEGRAEQTVTTQYREYFFLFRQNRTGRADIEIWKNTGAAQTTSRLSTAHWWSPCPQMTPYVHLNTTCNGFTVGEWIYQEKWEHSVPYRVTVIPVSDICTQ